MYEFLLGYFFSFTTGKSYYIKNSRLVKIVKKEGLSMRSFAFTGNWKTTATSEHFALGIIKKMEEHGYQFCDEPDPEIQLVFNFVNPAHPQPFRRKGNGTFVITVTENFATINRDNVLSIAYPILIRSLGNMMLFLDRSAFPHQTYFITLEQGCYSISGSEGKPNYFSEVFKRIEPLAQSKLVINNIFVPDLPDHLWNGDQVTQSLGLAGRKLEEMNLLPTPFPIEEVLSPQDLRHIQRLFGIGGLSYGNLSARAAAGQNAFWMSASGVNKGALVEIGRDILYIKNYNAQESAMEISVPPGIKPRRVSVDAIEHWMIYSEHPEVGAIVHVHAWIDGIPSTEINYPCGTIQLAEAVAKLVRQAEDPSRAIIGLKNHGLTITGRSLEDIFERIDGKILPQVPMS
jgi:ribulose-5-phosphate 4-epimerase/fuculose-1-phosphate aldolase